MKRFYKQAEAVEAGAGWTVQLDGRAIKTQGGQPLVLPTQALAALLADEWNRQGEEIDPRGFVHRDMADYAIDVVARGPAALAEKLLAYAETDTLCYRAGPDEPFWKRQQEVWEPLVSAFEAREGVKLERVSGIVHRAVPAATLETLRTRLGGLAPFTLAALETLTSLAASLCIGLSALESEADADALWDAANLEEDWQAEQWGQDEEAADRRARRHAQFLKALEFARAAA